MAASHMFLSTVAVTPPWIKREECAAQIQLRAGGLWERQDESQRQLQPLRQVHGHQLQLQRRSHRGTHQQLPAGEGEDDGGALTYHRNIKSYMLFWDTSARKVQKSSARLVFKWHLFSWMFHEVMTKRCEGTSTNRCVCEADAVPLRVNEWLTWGYLMLLYLSALLNNRLAPRAGVNDGAMIHFQRPKINSALYKRRVSPQQWTCGCCWKFGLSVCLEEKTNYTCMLAVCPWPHGVTFRHFEIWCISHKCVNPSESEEKRPSF